LRDHRGQHGKGRLALERRPAGEQLVQHAAQAEQVGTAVDRLALRLLGGHVHGRADDHSGIRDSRVLDLRAGDAEVEQLDPLEG
jgi:hypothetical protein